MLRTLRRSARPGAAAPVRRGRRGRRALATLGAASAVVALAALPAQAHGAPSFPVSRSLACSATAAPPTQPAACQAAIAAGGTQAFTMFDNLRVPNVNGQDRTRIPNGRLCSAGLDAYRGLDLARADWPSTLLTPGTAVTMQYATPIPHPGTFSLYLTTADYDPNKPLTWDVLEQQPFATVTDPPIVDGAYQIPMTVPTGLSGRQLIYTIWRTSPTDTYYSCSDVDLGAMDDAGAAGGTGAAGAPAPSVGPQYLVAPAAVPEGVGAPPAAAGRLLPFDLAAQARARGINPTIVVALLAGAGVLAAIGLSLIRSGPRPRRR